MCPTHPISATIRDKHGENFAQQPSHPNRSTPSQCDTSSVYIFNHQPMSFTQERGKLPPPLPPAWHFIVHCSLAAPSACPVTDNSSSPILEAGHLEMKREASEWSSSKSRGTSDDDGNDGRDGAGDWLGDWSRRRYVTWPSSTTK